MSDQQHTGPSSAPSKRFLQSLSKNSKSVDIAELKLKYEEQIDNKNQRIRKLERKNEEYLELLSTRAHAALEGGEDHPLRQMQGQLPQETV
jgi:hypothetical protein